MYVYKFNLMLHTFPWAHKNRGHQFKRKVFVVCVLQLASFYEFILGDIILKVVLG